MATKRFLTIFLLTAFFVLPSVTVGFDDVKKRTEPLIRQHRMGELTIQTRPGVSVRVTQLKHQFLFGTALNAKMFVSDSVDAQDRQIYQSTVRSHFNAAVTENALKWKHTNSTGPMSDFRKVDAVLDWCEANSIRLRGHTIFWGRPATIPQWVKDLDRVGLRQVLAQRAREVTTRYKGRIHEYDLNNEMLRPNLFVERLGEDITKQMFLWAKEADPAADLYLNDFNILNSIDFSAPQQNVKMRAEDLDRYIQQIQDFLQRGIPVDGVGVQSHMFTGTADGDIDFDRMQHALDKLAQFNLPIKITEFDLPAIVDEQKQAKNLDAFYRTCFAHPAVAGIFMWGFWEGAHWMPHAALWTKDWQIKPAALAYENLVLNEWWTSWEGKADEEGNVSVAAFYGAHLVEVGYHRQIVELTRQQGNKTVVIGRYGLENDTEETTADGFNLDTPIGELLEHQAARAILEEYLSTEVINDKQFAMAKTISLKKLATFVPQLLTEEKLKAIDQELSKLAP